MDSTWVGTTGRMTTASQFPFYWSYHRYHPESRELRAQWFDVSWSQALDPRKSHLLLVHYCHLYLLGVFSFSFSFRLLWRSILWRWKWGLTRVMFWFFVAYQATFRLLQHDEHSLWLLSKTPQFQLTVIVIVVTIFCHTTTIGHEPWAMRWPSEGNAGVNTKSVLYKIKSNWSKQMTRPHSDIPKRPPSLGKEVPKRPPSLGRLAGLGPTPKGISTKRPPALTLNSPVPYSRYLRSVRIHNGFNHHPSQNLSRQEVRKRSFSPPPTIRLKE